MTQDEYILLRNQNRLNDIVYDFYKEGGGTYAFEEVMATNVMMFMDIEKFLDEADALYSVMLIKDKGKVIKVEAQQK